LMTEVANDCLPTVLIADDNPRVIEAISRLLRSAYNVIKVAADGEEAVSGVCSQHPRLAIIDICMPKLDGIAAARKLRQSGIDTKIILISQIEDADYVREVRTVADGYVLKRRMLTDLPLALASALSGSFFMSH
jgi:DNA-binding NarL/FixJ family response regulator